MHHQEGSSYIELISCIQPTLEERNNAEYIPRLQMNPDAKRIISERFQSPISILVYVGDSGVGKSKLASLTVATLQKEKFNQHIPTFRSGADVLGVTRGIWMWSTPLKDLNNNKQGSILLLDCEGMGSLDENTSANLYLFCMLISTTFAVILRPARVERRQCDRLFNALLRFENMKTPYVLPDLRLVPLELPRLIDNDKIIPPCEWIDEVFSSNVSGNTLSTTENQALETRYKYIREKLPKIDVVNMNYLPIIFRNDSLNLDDMFISIRKKSCEDYYNSLYAAIDNFLKAGGKRLPGSSSNLLFVHPAELAELMSDLIDVINADKIPNPDVLIGKYLLTRFNNEIVEQKKAEFENKLLSYAEQYVKGNIKQNETETQKENTNTNLTEERNRLTNLYIDEMTELAEKKIYGSNSILFDTDLFQENLNSVKEQMNQYTEPELLIEEIRAIYNISDQRDQENRRRMLSEKTEKKLGRIIDRICREQRINESINRSELQVDLEQCSTCGRSAGVVSIIHSKEFCRSPSKRNGNYYRYNYESDQMVCDACRQIEKISITPIECSKCGTRRRITCVR